MSGLGKQAKILSEAQIRAALGHVEGSRYPERDRVMVLLSVKAGMRAKEIASLTWGMLTDAEGEIADVIASPTRRARASGAVGRSLCIRC
jgi:integrase